MKPRTAGILAALLLAVAIHADWHVARSHEHGGLSGSLGQHWLLAIPVFVLLTGAFRRFRPEERFRGSVLLIGGGAFVGQILEPLWEMLSEGLPWSWMVQGPRWTAFAEFMTAGLLAFMVLMAWLEGREPGS